MSFNVDCLTTKVKINQIGMTFLLTNKKVDMAEIIAKQMIQTRRKQVKNNGIYKKKRFPSLFDEILLKSRI